MPKGCPLIGCSSRPLQRDNRITVVPREATNASKRGSLGSLKLVLTGTADVGPRGTDKDLRDPRKVRESSLN